MKVHVRYETRYVYEEEVSFSPHIFRLFPKADPDLRVESFTFSASRNADIQHRRDIFDNVVAICFFPDKSSELKANLTLELELREKNAFHFILAPEATSLPFTYSQEESTLLAPYLRPSTTRCELPFWRFERGPTVDRLVALNSSLHDHLRYDRREEGEARSPAETIAAGGGACRDFAVLLADVLRNLGVAARLVSGYLVESGPGPRTAEGALHAWTEAYLPGAGWIGMDPTNGVFCAHSHIAAAIGLVPGHITPVSGRYYGSTRVACRMSADLEISVC